MHATRSPASVAEALGSFEAALAELLDAAAEAKLREQGEFDDPFSFADAFLNNLPAIAYALSAGAPVLEWEPAQINANETERVLRAVRQWTEQARLLLLALAAGAITQAAFYDSLVAAYRQQATNSYLAGRRAVGNLAPLSDEEEDDFEGEIADDLDRLGALEGGGIGTLIAAILLDPTNYFGSGLPGDPFAPKHAASAAKDVARYTNRIEQYADRIRNVSHAGELDALTSAFSGDATIVWWTLGAADHCIDCVRLSDMSPFYASTLEGNGLYPGSGHTRCGGRCQCGLSYEIPKTVCGDAFGGAGLADLGISEAAMPPAKRDGGRNVWIQEAASCELPIAVRNLNPAGEYDVIDRADAFSWDEDIANLVTREQQELAWAALVEEIAKSKRGIQIVKPTPGARKLERMFSDLAGADDARWADVKLRTYKAQGSTYRAAYRETTDAFRFEVGATTDGLTLLEPEMTLRALHDLAEDAVAAGKRLEINGATAGPGLREWLETVGAEQLRVGGAAPTITITTPSTAGLVEATPRLLPPEAEALPGWPDLGLLKPADPKVVDGLGAASMEVRLYVDPAGNHWLFKAEQAQTEAAGARLAQEMGLRTPGARVVTLEGQTGSLIPIIPDSQSFGRFHYAATVDNPSTIPRAEVLADSEVGEMARQSVLDFAIGNVDAHEENWLVDGAGKLWGIDRSRGFIGAVATSTNPASFFGTKILAPNPTLGKMLRYPERSGLFLHLDPADVRIGLDRLDAISDSRYLELVGEALDEVVVPFGTRDDAIEILLKRKHEAREGFEAMFRDVVAGAKAESISPRWQTWLDAGGTFDRGLIQAVATPPPAVLVPEPTLAEGLRALPPAMRSNTDRLSTVGNNLAAWQDDFVMAKTRNEARQRLFAILTNAPDDARLDALGLDQLNVILARAEQLKRKGVLLGNIDAITDFTRVAAEEQGAAGFAVGRRIALNERNKWAINPGNLDVPPTVYNDIGGLFAHEVGHTVWHDMSTSAQGRLLEIHARLGDDVGLSTYAKEGVDEWFGEAFAAITAPGYRPGTIDYDAELWGILAADGKVAARQATGRFGAFELPAAPAATDEIGRWAERIHTAPAEELVIVDPASGKLLHHLEGKPDGVPVTADDLKRMQGKVVMHNHPAHDDGFVTTFSRPDLRIAADQGKALDVVVTDEYIYLLAPGEAGWPSGDKLIATLAKVEKREKARYATANKAYYADLKAGKIADADKAARIAELKAINSPHSNLTQVADELGLRYERRPIGEVLGSAPATKPPPSKAWFAPGDVTPYEIPSSPIPLNAPPKVWSGHIPHEPPLPVGLKASKEEIAAARAAADEVRITVDDVIEGRTGVAYSWYSADAKKAKDAGLVSEKLDGAWFVARSDKELDPLRAYLAKEGASVDDDEFWALLGYSTQDLNTIDAASDIARGKRLTAGVMIMEPDGRMWLLAPKNKFAGYENTVIKGGVDAGETTAQGAIREAWEEAGFSVELDGYLGDYLNTDKTSITRMYVGHRTGGGPLYAHQKETFQVRLVEPDEAKAMLTRYGKPDARDQAILADTIEAVNGTPGSINYVVGADDVAELAEKVTPVPAHPPHVPEAPRKTPKRHGINPIYTDPQPLAVSYGFDPATVKGLGAYANDIPPAEKFPYHQTQYKLPDGDTQPMYWKVEGGAATILTPPPVVKAAGDAKISAIDDALAKVKAGTKGSTLDDEDFLLIADELAPTGTPNSAITAIVEAPDGTEMRVFGWYDEKGNIVSTIAAGFDPDGTLNEIKLIATSEAAQGKGYATRLADWVEDNGYDLVGTIPKTVGFTPQGKAFSLKWLARRKQMLVNEQPTGLLALPSPTAPEAFGTGAGTKASKAKLDALEVPATATANEREAIDIYVGTNMPNDYLRSDGKVLSYGGASIGKLSDAQVAKAETQIKLLDGLAAKTELAEPTIVYRGVPIGQHNHNPNLKVGDLIIDKGYQSTSLEGPTAGIFATGEGPGGYLYRIQLPAGQHGVWIDGFKDLSVDQAEFLLPRGTKLQVQAIAKDVKVGWLSEPVTVVDLVPEAITTAATEVKAGTGRLFWANSKKQVADPIKRLELHLAQVQHLADQLAADVALGTVRVNEKLLEQVPQLREMLLAAGGKTIKGKYVDIGRNDFMKLAKSLGDDAPLPATGATIPTAPMTNHAVEAIPGGASAPSVASMLDQVEIYGLNDGLVDPVTLTVNALPLGGPTSITLVPSPSSNTITLAGDLSHLSDEVTANVLAAQLLTTNELLKAAPYGKIAVHPSAFVGKPKTQTLIDAISTQPPYMTSDQLAAWAAATKADMTAFGVNYDALASKTVLASDGPVSTGGNLAAQLGLDPVEIEGLPTGFNNAPGSKFEVQVGNATGVYGFTPGELVWGELYAPAATKASTSTKMLRLVADAGELSKADTVAVQGAAWYKLPQAVRGHLEPMGTALPGGGFRFKATELSQAMEQILPSPAIGAFPPGALNDVLDYNPALLEGVEIGQLAQFTQYEILTVGSVGVDQTGYYWRWANTFTNSGDPAAVRQVQLAALRRISKDIDDTTWLAIPAKDLDSGMAEMLASRGAVWKADGWAIRGDQLKPLGHEIGYPAGRPVSPAADIPTVAGYSGPGATVAAKASTGTPEGASDLLTALEKATDEKLGGGFYLTDIPTPGKAILAKWRRLGNTLELHAVGVAGGDVEAVSLLVARMAKAADESEKISALRFLPSAADKFSPEVNAMLQAAGAKFYAGGVKLDRAQLLALRDQLVQSATSAAAKVDAAVVPVLGPAYGFDGAVAGHLAPTIIPQKQGFTKVIYANEAGAEAYIRHRRLSSSIAWTSLGGSSDPALLNAAAVRHLAANADDLAGDALLNGLRFDAPSSLPSQFREMLEAHGAYTSGGKLHMARQQVLDLAEKLQPELGHTAAAVAKAAPSPAAAVNPTVDDLIGSSKWVGQGPSATDQVGLLSKWAWGAPYGPQTTLSITPLGQTWVGLAATDAALEVGTKADAMAGQLHWLAKAKAENPTQSISIGPAVFNNSMPGEKLKDALVAAGAQYDESGLMLIDEALASAIVDSMEKGIPLPAAADLHLGAAAAPGPEAAGVKLSGQLGYDPADLDNMSLASVVGIPGKQGHMTLSGKGLTETYHANWQSFDDATLLGQGKPVMHIGMDGLVDVAGADGQKIAALKLLQEADNLTSASPGVYHGVGLYNDQLLDLPELKDAMIAAGAHIEPGPLGMVWFEPDDLHHFASAIDGNTAVPKVVRGTAAAEVPTPTSPSPLEVIGLADDPNAAQWLTKGEHTNWAGAGDTIEHLSAYGDINQVTWLVEGDTLRVMGFTAPDGEGPVALAYLHDLGKYLERHPDIKYVNFSADLEFVVYSNQSKGPLQKLLEAFGGDVDVETSHLEIAIDQLKALSHAVDDVVPGLAPISGGSNTAAGLGHWQPSVLDSITASNQVIDPNAVDFQGYVSNQLTIGGGWAKYTIRSPGYEDVDVLWGTIGTTGLTSTQVDAAYAAALADAASVAAAKETGLLIPTSIIDQHPALNDLLQAYDVSPGPTAGAIFDAYGPTVRVPTYNVGQLSDDILSNAPLQVAIPTPPVTPGVVPLDDLLHGTAGVTTPAPGPVLLPKYGINHAAIAGQGLPVEKPLAQGFTNLTWGDGGSVKIRVSSKSVTWAGSSGASIEQAVIAIDAIGQKLVNEAGIAKVVVRNTQQLPKSWRDLLIEVGNGTPGKPGEVVLAREDFLSLRNAISNDLAGKAAPAAASKAEGVDEILGLVASGSLPAENAATTLKVVAKDLDMQQVMIQKFNAGEISKGKANELIHAWDPDLAPIQADIVGPELKPGVLADELATAAPAEKYGLNTTADEWEAITPGYSNDYAKNAYTNYLDPAIDKGYKPYELGAPVSTLTARWGNYTHIVGWKNLGTTWNGSPVGSVIQRQVVAWKHLERMAHEAAIGNKTLFVSGDITREFDWMKKLLDDFGAVKLELKSPKLGLGYRLDQAQTKALRSFLETPAVPVSPVPGVGATVAKATPDAAKAATPPPIVTPPQPPPATLGSLYGYDADSVANLVADHAGVGAAGTKVLTTNEISATKLTQVYDDEWLTGVTVRYAQEQQGQARILRVRYAQGGAQGSSQTNALLASLQTTIPAHLNNNADVARVLINKKALDSSPTLGNLLSDAGWKETKEYWVLDRADMPKFVEDLTAGKAAWMKEPTIGVGPKVEVGPLSSAGAPTKATPSFIYDYDQATVKHHFAQIVDTVTTDPELQQGAVAHLASVNGMNARWSVSPSGKTIGWYGLEVPAGMSSEEASSAAFAIMRKLADEAQGHEGFFWIKPEAYDQIPGLRQMLIDAGGNETAYQKLGTAVQMEAKKGATLVKAIDADTMTGLKISAEGAADYLGYNIQIAEQLLKTEPTLQAGKHVWPNVKAINTVSVTADGKQMSWTLSTGDDRLPAAVAELVWASDHGIDQLVIAPTAIADMPKFDKFLLSVGAKADPSGNLVLDAAGISNARKIVSHDALPVLLGGDPLPYSIVDELNATIADVVSAATTELKHTAGVASKSSFVVNGATVETRFAKSSTNIYWSGLDRTGASFGQVRAAGTAQMRSFLNDLTQNVSLASLDIDLDVIREYPALREVLLKYGAKEMPASKSGGAYLTIERTRAIKLRNELEQELSQFTPSGGTTYIQQQAALINWPSADVLFEDAARSKALSGQTRKHILVDSSGSEWLFKPGASGRGAATDKAVAQLAEALGLPVPPVRIYTVRIDGQEVTGSLQKMVAKSKDMRAAGTPSPELLTGTQTEDLMRHSVLDWVTNNDDAHIGNWLVDENGKLWSIDKSRSWVSFHTNHDVLDTLSEGNQGGTPWMFLWMRKAREDPTLLRKIHPQTFAAPLRRLRAMSDEEFRRIVEPVALAKAADKRTAGAYYGKPDKLIADMLARKNAAAGDIERYLAKELRTIQAKQPLPDEWKRWLDSGAELNLDATPQDLWKERLAELNAKHGDFEAHQAAKLFEQSQLSEIRRSTYAYGGAGTGGSEILTGQHRGRVYGSETIRKKVLEKYRTDGAQRVAEWEELNEWAMLNILNGKSSLNPGADDALRAFFNADTGTLRVMRTTNRWRTPDKYLQEISKTGLRDVIGTSVGRQVTVAGGGGVVLYLEVPVNQVFATGWMNLLPAGAGERELLISGARVDQIIHIAPGERPLSTGEIMKYDGAVVTVK